MAARSGNRHTVSRRDFLRGAGALLTALAAGACEGNKPEDYARAVTPPSQPTDVPTAQPTVSAPAPTEAVATTPAIQPTVTAAREPAAQVAIAQAQSYEVGPLRDSMRDLLDSLGGLGDIVHAGDRVAIKVNLVGGSHFAPPSGVTAIESYMTHPELVRALCQFLRDAGARELFIVEAIYDADSFAVYGYEEVAADLGATLVDLNSPAPHSEFGSAPVGTGTFIYDDIVVNHLLNDIDCFISFAKMKCHANAGVSLSMKNLIGILPISHYRLKDSEWVRSAVHGADPPVRLPRAIVDLNRARPVHLALIDGIKTAEGGAFPGGAFNPIEPGVLLAGRNAVATDAVATVVMGFDPTMEPPAPPFAPCDNYLNLARGLGLGTNRLEEIAVVGASIQDVRFAFEPARRI